jgi:hypothetical protein
MPFQLSADMFSSSSPLYPTAANIQEGGNAAFIPGSCVVFTMLPSWTGVSELLALLSRENLNLQNKYLIKNDNNNTKKKNNRD